MPAVDLPSGTPGAGVDLPSGGYGRTFLYQVIRACERVDPRAVHYFLDMPAEDQQTFLAYAMVREAEERMKA